MRDIGIALAGIVVITLACFLALHRNPQTVHDFLIDHHCESTKFYYHESGVLILDYQCRDGITMQIMLVEGAKVN